MLIFRFDTLVKVDSHVFCWFSFIYLLFFFSFYWPHNYESKKKNFLSFSLPPLPSKPIQTITNQTWLLFDQLKKKLRVDQIREANVKKQQNNFNIEILIEQFGLFIRKFTDLPILYHCEPWLWAVSIRNQFCFDCAKE